MAEVLLVEQRGAVVVATLNRPEKLNAFNSVLIGAVMELLDRLELDRSTRAIVVTGAGRAFSAGADISAFQPHVKAGPTEAVAHFLRPGQRMTRRVEAFPKPIIAAVNGLAFGGGCELAMACDVRIAAFSATFGQPEIGLGIIPGFGGTQRLPRLVGPAKALEMNTTGEAISAEEAYEYGLVNRVVPDHELFDTALQWARKFAAQAPLALEQIKRVSHQADLDDGIAAEKQGFGAAFGSEDAKEGISAFIQKRTARFQGK